MELFVGLSIIFFSNVSWLMYIVLFKKISLILKLMIPVIILIVIFVLSIVICSMQLIIGLVSLSSIFFMIIQFIFNALFENNKKEVSSNIYHMYIVFILSFLGQLFFVFSLDGICGISS